MMPSIPGMDALIADVAAGRLRGTEAFDAIVGRIAAHETPPGADEATRRQIHDQVVLVVSQDRSLCQLIFQAAEPPPQAPAPAPPRRPSAPTRPAAKPKGKTKAGGKKKKSRRPAEDDVVLPPPLSDEEIDAELEAIEREREARRRGDGDEFGAPQRKGQLLGGLALGGLAIAGGAAWFLTQPTECDRLVKRICREGKTKACELVKFSDALEAEGVDEAKCVAAMTEIDAAVEGKNNTDRPHAFDTALVASLGFDPRGDDAPTPPPPKPQGPPPPTVVVEGQAAMAGMFLDRAHLYWTNANPPGVFRVRNIGGAAEAFGSQPDPIDVTPTKDFVYWLSRTPTGSAVWVDKIRGAHQPSTIALEGYAPTRAAFLGPEFAFIDGPTGAVVIAPVSGGAPRVLVPGRVEPPGGRKKKAPEVPPPTLPTELTGDATSIFVATPAPVSTVWAVPRDGQAPARALATGQTTPKHLAADDTHVYWVEAGSGSIVRAPKAGGPVEVLATGQQGAGALAMDATHVYWPAGPAGAVLSVPKAGGEITTVASGLTSPRFVAVDSVALFWESGGTVYRQAR
ncbi:MAG: hypothetical protein AAGA54_17755 [Myxococcota bacterium]